MGSEEGAGERGPRLTVSSPSDAVSARLRDPPGLFLVRVHEVATAGRLRGLRRSCGGAVALSLRLGSLPPEDLIGLGDCASAQTTPCVVRVSISNSLRCITVDREQSTV